MQEVFTATTRNGTQNGWATSNETIVASNAEPLSLYSLYHSYDCAWGGWAFAVVYVCIWTGYGAAISTKETSS